MTWPRVDRRARSTPLEAAYRDELFDLLNGYWRTQLLCAAAELGVADVLAEGPCDIATLARRTGADGDALTRLLRALVGFGVVARTADGWYSTTPRGRWLERSRVGGLHARALLIRRLWYPAWAGLAHSVRTGETAFEHTFGSSLFDYLADHPDTAPVFDQTMAESTRVTAAEVADAYDARWAGTIVDLGGGTGALLAEILARHPQARGILVETPAVAERARAHLQSAGDVDARCDVREGDFFVDVPSGADLYLLSWILHDWPDSQAVQILSNCRGAMSPDGRLLVVEAVLPEAPQPTNATLYDLHMMAVAGGRERTEDKYDELLAAAGLERTATIPTPGLRSVLEARTRSRPGERWLRASTGKDGSCAS